MEPTETAEMPETEKTTPYKFVIRVTDELHGCIKSPKTKEETLEILHSDLQKAFGTLYEITTFEEIPEEEWEAAVLEAEDFSPDAPRVLN